MVVTTIETQDGKIITRTGETGITMTGKRGEGNDFEVLVEVGSDIPGQELVATVGTFLVILEEKFGERFVTQCLNHYIEDTGKKTWDEHGSRLVVFRGKKRK